MTFLASLFSFLIGASAHSVDAKSCNEQLDDSVRRLVQLVDKEWMTNPSRAGMTRIRFFKTTERRKFKPLNVFKADLEKYNLDPLLVEIKNQSIVTEPYSVELSFNASRALSRGRENEYEENKEMLLGTNLRRVLEKMGSPKEIEFTQIDALYELETLQKERTLKVFIFANHKRRYGISVFVLSGSDKLF